MESNVLTRKVVGWAILFLLYCTIVQKVNSQQQLDQQSELIETIVVPEFGFGEGEWNYSPESQLLWKERTDSTCGKNAGVYSSQSPAEFFNLDRITHCLGPSFNSNDIENELNFMIVNNEYDIEIKPTNGQTLEFTGLPISLRDIPNTQVSCNSSGTFLLDRIKVKFNSIESESNIQQGNGIPGSLHRPIGESFSSMELEFLFYRQDLPNFDFAQQENNNSSNSSGSLISSTKIIPIENARVVVSVLIDLEKDEKDTNITTSFDSNTQATSENIALREVTEAILFAQEDNNLLLNQVGNAAVFQLSDVKSILPIDTSKYYLYNGTLSQPPCTLNIKRMVLVDRLHISANDLAIWRTIENGNNGFISNNITRLAQESAQLFLIGNNLQTPIRDISQFVYLAYIVLGVFVSILISLLIVKCHYLYKKKRETRSNAKIKISKS